MDDDQPVQKSEPPVTEGKKAPKLDSDSDDDFLNDKKKQISVTPTIEEKIKTNTENGDEKRSVKALSVEIKF